MKFTAYLLVLSGLFIASCNSDADKTKNKKLVDPSTIVHNPRTINGIPAEEKANLPVMNFRDTTHNFGTINEGERVTFDFEFTNSGKSPLLIESVEGSCGCTVADYPREPIAPGKAAVVKAVFASAGKQGHQEKSLAITANTLRGLHRLYIEAEVIPEKN